MTTYSIPDMSCGHCKVTVEKTILALDPQATLSFNMPARTVDVQTQSEQSTVKAALTDAGYPATVG